MQPLILLIVLKEVTLCSQIAAKRGLFWAIHAYVMQFEAMRARG
jgi:hypothetical protein